MIRAAVRAAGLVIAMLGASFAVPASAHDARPLSISIVEQADGIYRAVVRVPPVVDALNMPSVVWPDECTARESAPLRGGFGETILLTCSERLDGRAIGIEYPIYNPSLSSMIRLETIDGIAHAAVLAPDEPTWIVPAEPDALEVAKDYLALGVEHILGGPDHLLFVAGLLLLARRPGRVLLAVTGFTAAHSLTLSAAALGYVSVAIEPIEAMIALSVLFLAAEVARGDASSLGHRYPIALSFVFGLLHGFGFASALGEIGLPTRELVTGLLFFNLGVEVGQVAFIAGVAAVVLAWRAAISRLPASAAAAGVRARSAAAYVLGVPSAFWFVERTAAAFS